MPIKSKLQNVLVLIVGLIGAYLILTSDKVNVDSYSLVITILVGVFIVYLYFLLSRNRVD